MPQQFARHLASATKCTSSSPTQRPQPHPKCSTTFCVGLARRRLAGTRLARSSQSCTQKVGELRRSERWSRRLPRARMSPNAKLAAFGFACLAKLLSKLSSPRRPTRMKRTISPSAKQRKNYRNRQTTISTRRTTTGRSFDAELLRASDKPRSRNLMTPPRPRFRLMLYWGCGGSSPLVEMGGHHQAERAAARIQVRFEVVLVPPAL